MTWGRFDPFPFGVDADAVQAAAQRRIKQADDATGDAGAGSKQPG